MRIAKSIFWHALRSGMRSVGADLKRLQRTTVFITNDYSIPDHWECGLDSAPFSTNETHLVVHEKGVTRRVYCSDPREPYFVENYISIDAFFHKFLADAAFDQWVGHLHRLPHMIEAYKSAYDRSNTSGNRTERMLVLSELMSKEKNKLKILCTAKTKRFMSGTHYRIMRLFLNLRA